MTAHGVAFPVAPQPFTILVALVRGDVHQGADSWRAPRGFEHVDRAHHVGGKGFHGLCVGQAHQGLRSHVEDHFGLVLLKHAQQVFQISHIAQMGSRKPWSHLGGFEQARIRGWFQRIAHHFRPQRLQPEADPAALEAGVACNKNAPAAPERGIHGHIFQGALPLVHMSSSCTLSRKVSMGCQKPGCW